MMVRLFAISVALAAVCSLSQARGQETATQSAAAPSPAAPSPSGTAAADPAALEFFEKEVRPILVARCYECHSGTSKRLEGGLRLDSLAAATKGGDTGPAVVPGNIKESLLVDAINYGELYQMPPKSRMPAAEIAVLTKWVEMGAPWPASPAGETAGGPEAFDLAKRKAEHWCWQPLADPAVPTTPNPKSEIRNPIDAFIRAKLAAAGLSPAPPAEPRVLIRRLSFDLVGLPPTPAEVDEFLRAYEQDPQQAIESLVDRLLASPHFGERWGRHWLDLVRYAESRGHEFDYNIPNAFEYRDYVIRALNADVPYDQFVTEHIAGDLVPEPRRHPEHGGNESILGTGFWFLGEWIHSPVDIRKDECDRIDNQIDVFTKTFLGLTVSCARCHDHKFDAISQADYYALAGYLQSSSYRLTRFEKWQQDREAAAELAELDRQVGSRFGKQLADVLRPQAVKLAEQLAAGGEMLAQELGVEEIELGSAETIIDYRQPAASGELNLARWNTDGYAFGIAPVRAGQFLTESLADGSPIWATVGGAYVRVDAAAPLAPASEGDQGRLGGWQRVGRTLKTPTWTLKTGQVHYLIEGAGHVYAAVDSHAMLNGPLHNELAKETGGNRDLPMRWITHDLSRYVGHRVHLQFSPKAGEGFRVLAVVEGDRPPAPMVRPNRLVTEALAAADDAAKAAALAKLVESTLDLAAAGTLADDAQPRDRAALAHWLARQELTKEEPAASLAEIRQQASDERAKLAARLDNPSRVAIAMWDGTAVDENLLIRGNHRTVGDVVPRRMLAAICGDEAESSPESESAHDKQPGSGRLELARQLVDPANPFTSRVMVNRIWQHLLGRGIVPSVDNFGVLGQEPTHPELLDHLAQQFIREGWSVKRLIRTIVLSDTYQQASGGTDAALVAADEADPQNLLFHRQNLRRLEGEAIRDAILTISGRLDRTQFGPSVPVHLTPFMQGRGRPGGSGPLDGAGRRSIYQAVRRNFLPPMMLAFDTPIPFSTVGRRNVSNVPAQALILMNDPFVVEEAKRWAKRIVADRDGSPETRIRQMYLEAFSREPTAAETAAAREFLSLQAAEYGLAADAAVHDERVWGDLAHVLFNVKEFVLLN
jgi:hypothetical protein